MARRAALRRREVAGAVPDHPTTRCCRWVSTRCASSSRSCRPATTPAAACAPTCTASRRWPSCSCAARPRAPACTARTGWRRTRCSRGWCSGAASPRRCSRGSTGRPTPPAVAVRAAPTASLLDDRHRGELQTLMSRDAGVLRDEKGLDRRRRRAGRAGRPGGGGRPTTESWEATNLLTVASALVRAARAAGGDARLALARRLPRARRRSAGAATSTPC